MIIESFSATKKTLEGALNSVSEQIRVYSQKNGYVEIKRSAPSLIATPTSGIVFYSATVTCEFRKENIDNI